VFYTGCLPAAVIALLSALARGLSDPGTEELNLHHLYRPMAF
jgi:hypothetical protein